MKRAKTRQEIAEEYGINRRTLQRWLKKARIELPERDLVPPRVQDTIYEKFGSPDMSHPDT